MEKCCKKCNNVQDISCFRKQRNVCKTCDYEYNKNYHIDHKSETIKYRQKYWQDNKNILTIKKKEYDTSHKDEMAKMKRKWQIANKEKINIYQSGYFKKRKAADPAFKLRINVSKNISNQLFNAKSSKKSKSILIFLSYTINELKLHLEKQLKPWMTWSNYGKYNKKTWDDNNSTTWTWQLDHIIPQSDLPYISMEDDNFKKCWALNNLRPLSSKQNFLDGVRRVRHVRKM